MALEIIYKKFFSELKDGDMIHYAIEHPGGLMSSLAYFSRVRITGEKKTPNKNKVLTGTLEIYNRLNLSTCSADSLNHPEVIDLEKILDIGQLVKVAL